MGTKWVHNENKPNLEPPPPYQCFFFQDPSVARLASFFYENGVHFAIVKFLWTNFMAIYDNFFMESRLWYFPMITYLAMVCRFRVAYLAMV
jgi:hypothetical protein